MVVIGIGDGLPRGKHVNGIKISIGSAARNSGVCQPRRWVAQLLRRGWEFRMEGPGHESSKSFLLPLSQVTEKQVTLFTASLLGEDNSYE